MAAVALQYTKSSCKIILLSEKQTGRGALLQVYWGKHCTYIHTHTHTHTLMYILACIPIIVCVLLYTYVHTYVHMYVYTVKPL